MPKDIPDFLFANIYKSINISINWAYLIHKLPLFVHIMYKTADFLNNRQHPKKMPRQPQLQRAISTRHWFQN